jgi:molecular chaperone DnaJ
MAKRDYYEVLGIGKSTPQEAIKKAYRKLALKYHPDRNKGDKASEEKFKEASEAYHVLSDKERRQNYDQFGHAAFDGAGGRGGFANFDFTNAFSDIFGSDIFEDFFDGFGGDRRSGRRRQSENRGADLRYDLTISLEDAYSGKKQEIKYSSSEKCDRCNGHGSEPGSSPSECSACDGHGQVRSNQGFFTVQQTCPQCGGSGEEISNPCKNCRGIGKKQTYKKLSVTIPKGVDDGTRIRLSGKGEAGIKGSSNGDLYIFINVNSHDIFKRSEENLYFEFPISIADAALGTILEVPTIGGGKAKVKIPAGTQTGKQFRLRDKGMPIMRSRDYGDLYIRVTTEVPISLNKEQKELLEKFRTLENNKTTPNIKNFFEKARNFWKN